MTRIAQTEILCVYCPEPTRAHVWRQLRSYHPSAVHTNLPSGWLVVESPLGHPRSRFLGSSGNIRFLLGEEQLAPPAADVSALERLVAVVKHDESALARLEGDFSVVVLAPEGHFSAVRSCCGNPRLFGFSCNGVTAVSTRLDWLARVHPQALALDGMRLAIELSALAIAPNHASVLEGIVLVPCGHVAHWGRWQAPRVLRYWYLPQEIALRSAPEIAEAIEPELRLALRRHIDVRTNVALLLSGGLDSSLLFRLAAAETDAIDAVTTLPPREHTEFSREQYYSDLAARGCRQHAVFTLTPETLVDHLRAARGDLCPLGMEWLGLDGLTQRPEVVVSGWFADECWGFLRLAECLKSWFPRVPQLARHAPFKRELFRFWFNRHRSGRFTFPPANVAYPNILNRSLAASFDGWLANVSWVPRPEPVAEKLRLHRWLTDMGGSYAEAASYFGGRAIAPFTSRRLVELAAQSDPHALFERGLSKAPLRSLANRVLPRALAVRSDKGDWSPRTDGVRIPLPNLEAVQALLDTQYLADHPSLSLDDVWSVEWLNVLERGRLRVEHERKTIWP